MNEYGVITRFLLENPPAGIATGAIGTALLLAFILRLFRNEVRSAAIDKAAQALLQSVQEDNQTLRRLLREAEKNESEYRERIAKLTHLIETFTVDKKKADKQIEELTTELNISKTELLELQMKVSGQLSTIEDLSLRIRQLKSKRKTNDDDDDGEENY